MPSLSAAIDALAADFARAIVQAIRASNVQDIVGLTTTSPTTTNGATHSATSSKKRGRPKGSAKETTTKAVSLIVAYVKGHPGVTGEAARKDLGILKGRWNPYVRRAISEGKMTKKGERRATKYWAAP